MDKKLNKDKIREIFSRDPVTVKYNRNRIRIEQDSGTESREHK